MKLVEQENFINDNFMRYLKYYQKYNLSSDKVIIAVNNDLDKDDIELNEIVESFMNQNYFIRDNLKRYLQYHEKNSNLEFKEIITRVNSNIDQVFYKDIVKTDLSKDNLIIVNKFYYLPNDYIPSNLINIEEVHGVGQIKKEVYDAFKKMYNDAKEENLYLYISSPYRSYERQNTLYSEYVSGDGVIEADTYSARPGHSEHQTGLAFDLGTSTDHYIGNFKNSKEFRWIKENGHKYGFILRYPYGKTYITGYIYEPWHYRYVGVEVATYIYENNITYEEYYEYYVK